MNSPQFFLSTCLSATLLATALTAQAGGGWEFSREVRGEYGEIGFGLAIAMNGDMNGDGVDDILITAPGKANGAGAIYLYDGALGTKIWLINGAFPGDRLGREIITLGDTDGDGYAEFLSCAPGYDPPGLNYAGAVAVFDGATHSIIKLIEGTEDGGNFGNALLRIPDRNGDGYDEFAVAGNVEDVPGLVDAGRVHIIDGKSKKTLFRIKGVEANSLFGSSLATIGDINSDGVDDLLIGAKGTDVGADIDVGRAFVVSGVDGSGLLAVTGETASGFFGSTVSAAGDVNNDGYPDFLVAAQEYTDPIIGAEVGAVYLYSGLDGHLMRRWVGEVAGDKFGGAVAGNIDVNNDGILDVLIGAHIKDLNGVPDTVAGAVYVYSGDGNDLFLKWQGSSTRERLGSEFEILGDNDGDGMPEFFVSAPEWRPSVSEPRYGRLIQLEFDPYMFADNAEISSSTGGTINFDLKFPTETATQNYAILFSLGKGPTYYGNVGVPLTDGVMYNRTLSGDYSFLSSSGGITGQLDANGDATAWIIQNSLPSSMIGMEAYCATITVDGVGIPTHASGRSAITITP